MLRQSSQLTLSERAQPSGLTVLAVLAAESAWIYLVLLSIVAMAHLNVEVSAAAVMVPYALAILASRGAAMWLDVGRLVGKRLRANPLIGGGARAARWTYSTLFALVLPFTAALLYVGFGALVVFVIAWWQSYGGPPQADLASVLTASQSNPSTEAGSLFGWLVLLGVALWLRGTVLARGDTSMPPLLGRVAWGALLLLGIAFLTPEWLDPRSATPLVAAYLLLGSLAVLSERVDRASSERAQSPAWRWGTGVIALAVLLASLALGYLVATSLAGPVRAAWDALAAVVSPLVAAIIRWLLGIVGQGQAMPVPPEPSPAGAPQAGKFLELPDEIREVGRWFFNASWIVIIFYAIFSNLSRWLTSDRNGEKAAGTRDHLAWDLRAYLSRLLVSLVLLLAKRWPRFLRLLGTRSRTETAGTMRELYRSLLSWSARRGVPIQRWTTPREHQAALSTRWPHLESDFRFLTENYLRARYGDLAPAELDLEEGMLAFRRITSDGGTAAGAHIGKHRRGR